LDRQCGKDAVRLGKLALVSVCLLSADCGRIGPFSGIPRCAPIEAHAGADWAPVHPGHDFSLVLPPECKVLEQEDYWYVHDGRRWGCGTMVVEVQWGMWDPASFGDERQLCRTKIGGLTAAVARAPDSDSILVWYLTGSQYEPIISAWSTGAQKPKITMAIASSGEFTVKKGPKQ